MVIDDFGASPPSTATRADLLDTTDRRAAPSTRPAALLGLVLLHPGDRREHRRIELGAATETADQLATNYGSHAKA
jgi:hypothetical protein